MKSDELILSALTQAHDYLRALANDPHPHADVIRGGAKHRLPVLEEALEATTERMLWTSMRTTA